MVGTEADHKTISPNLIHAETKIAYRQGDDCGVDLTRDYLFRELLRVAVHRTDWAVGKQLSVHGKEGVEEGRIGL
jgi:hypothetical protein